MLKESILGKLREAYKEGNRDKIDGAVFLAVRTGIKVSEVEAVRKAVMWDRMKSY